MNRRPDDGEGAGLDRARRIVLAVLGVEIVVLTVTGIALYFLYRPSTSQAWGDLVEGDMEASVRISQALRAVHLLASRLAVLTAIATGLIVAIRRSGLRRWVDVATGVAIPLLTVATAFTGFLLPWDQLALWAVTVGTNYTGYSSLFGDSVRFVLIGGVEITRGTLLWWLLVHTLLLGPALAGLVLFVWRRGRRSLVSYPRAGRRAARIA